MKLHLGVLDIPHSTGSDSEDYVTTGDVAVILEDRYHIIELYVEEIGHEHIARAFEESAKTAIEDIFSGKQTGAAEYMAGGSSEMFALTGDATQEIEDSFRIFIDQKELDFVMPGVPTFASTGGEISVTEYSVDKAGNPKVRTVRRQRGAVNHRLKHPYAKDNPPRPSFRDTGLYQASFRAWVED